MAASRLKTLRLYKEILREGQKFANYNFKNYASRRTRDAFKENKSLTDTNKIDLEFKFGVSQLEVIKRQALISQMFKTDKLVIEKPLS